MNLKYKKSRRGTYYSTVTDLDEILKGFKLRVRGGEYYRNMEGVFLIMEKREEEKGKYTISFHLYPGKYDGGYKLDYPLFDKTPEPVFTVVMNTMEIIYEIADASRNFIMPYYHNGLVYLSVNILPQINNLNEWADRFYLFVSSIKTHEIKNRGNNSRLHNPPAFKPEIEHKDVFGELLSLYNDAIKPPK